MFFFWLVIFRCSIYFIDIECNESNVMVLKCHKFRAEWTCDFNFSIWNASKEAKKKQSQWFQLSQTIWLGIINQSNLWIYLYFEFHWFNHVIYGIALTQWANCHQIKYIKYIDAIKLAFIFFLFSTDFGLGFMGFSISIHIFFQNNFIK